MSVDYKHNYTTVRVRDFSQTGGSYISPSGKVYTVDTGSSGGASIADIGVDEDVLKQLDVEGVFKRFGNALQPGSETKIVFNKDLDWLGEKLNGTGFIVMVKTELEFIVNIIFDTSSSINKIKQSSDASDPIWEYGSTGFLTYPMKFEILDAKAEVSITGINRWIIGSNLKPDNNIEVIGEVSSMLDHAHETDNVMVIKRGDFSIGDYDRDTIVIDPDLGTVVDPTDPTSIVEPDEAYDEDATLVLNNLFSLDVGNISLFYGNLHIQSAKNITGDFNAITRLSSLIIKYTDASVSTANMLALTKDYIIDHCQYIYSVSNILSNVTGTIMIRKSGVSTVDLLDVYNALDKVHLDKFTLCNGIIDGLQANQIIIQGQEGIIGDVSNLMGREYINFRDCINVSGDISTLDTTDELNLSNTSIHGTIPLNDTIKKIDVRGTMMSRLDVLTSLADLETHVGNELLLVAMDISSSDDAMMIAYENVIANENVMIFAGVRPDIDYEDGFGRGVV